MRAILLLLLAGALAAAQRETIRVPVWVQAEAGAPGLARESLTVRMGGAAVQPSRLLGPGDDLVLLVVADMAGDITLAELAKKSLIELTGGLPSNALVGLLRAQDGLRVEMDPTADRAAVAGAIRKLPVSGRAGLLESVQKAAAVGDAVLAKAAVRVAVLFITDSDVSNYREDFTNPTINYSDSGDMSRRFRDGLVRERIAKLDQALSMTETPVFIVHLAYRTDTLNQAYQTGLMTLAATTGGASHFCRSQSEVADAISRAFESITAQYSLTVPLPDAPPKVLTVTMESPGRALNWRTRFAFPGN